ncbi:MAG TPA: NAD(P)H-hydrate dehydratase [Kofleriaceae bacterium]|nr:NAD(P)H-hydrate dehydratase [Kofleriaceae bacterium]
MLPVVTADEMRALDRRTIEDIGIPATTLMETAGRAVAGAALRMLDGRRGHVRVVCGPGNNGGDGFVAARVLRAQGVDAVVYLAAPREAVRGDARAHLEILERSGGVIRSIATPGQLAALAGAAAGSERGPDAPGLVTDLVIDALFGVGLARPIEGHLAEVVAWMQRAGRILAVDIPSGLDSDTGRALGAAVIAERTVTMAALKIALVSAPGFAHAGEVEVADIGIPPAVVAAADLRTSLIELGDVARWLPRGHALDHKGRRGHVLVVGGSPGMRGAGRLAAFAALRAGAGLSTLAADGELDAPDSVMTRSLAPGAALAPVLAGKAAVVIGPGLGASGSSEARVREVLASGLPAVLDADALNVLAADPAAIPGASGPVVITPHPGEASRLLGIPTAAIEADRLAAARSLADKTGAVVVLKGARTIVCDGRMRHDARGDLRCAINPTGGPSLATGGSGDVLAGTIGALLAQGLPAFDAAYTGVYVHGAAGDQLAGVHGARGVVSSDLPHAIAQAIAACSDPGRVSRMPR